MTHQVSSEYEIQLEAAKRFIVEHDDFLVVAHVQPDGDAAGSTFAVGWMLRQLGKTYTLINEGRMPEKFMFMAGDQPIMNGMANTPDRTFSSIISVDCADHERIGAVRAFFGEHALLLNIDHHATNDRFGQVNLVREDAAATVEVLFDLAVHMNLTLEHSLNVCIYSGLLTDTGGFRYANTTPKVMQTAAEMLRLGVKGHELAERLLEKMTVPQISLIKQSLSTLSFAYNQKLAWVSVTLEDAARFGAAGEDMDGLVNYPRNVEGVEVGMLFKERENGQVKISFRSAGSVDVARFAKTMGGGGHVRAAGCTVSGKLGEVIERVVKEMGQALG
ncbi:DHH family phosphoesterase [Paenibacillus thalictri]|uniref:Bifunctional oligoribonuclease/PAP phosphatase NrnA n=1 Tax=Paenibacillus thalictri TaxID=2527873 RepID=A0A4Q9DQB4_9BACL|nr:bifunctional oligoribonuclease/PAP phosphatase NrnA [Paenibacillus thalictri]TBL77773.1 bifunctional oligoribonuclease/PAP phosphatase NrnA [Paenibacillus thalictri]